MCCLKLCVTSEVLHIFALSSAKRCFSCASLLFSCSYFRSRFSFLFTIAVMNSAAFRRIVTLGARWLSSSSGMWLRNVWKLDLRSLRRFLSRMLWEARLCSSSDSAVLDPAELRRCACFVRHRRFLLGCKEWMIPADGEAWREHGADWDRFLFRLLTTGLSEMVTTSISSSPMSSSKFASNEHLKRKKKNHVL